MIITLVYNIKAVANYLLDKMYDDVLDKMMMMYDDDVFFIVKLIILLL